MDNYTEQIRILLLYTMSEVRIKYKPIQKIKQTIRLNKSFVIKASNSSGVLVIFKL